MRPSSSLRVTLLLAVGAWRIYCALGAVLAKAGHRKDGRSVNVILKNRMTGSNTRDWANDYSYAGVPQKQSIAQSKVHWGT